jgi:hypothetical protein
MWIFILLLLIGFAIIGVRVFRNGAMEEPAVTDSEAALAPPVPAVPVPAAPVGRRSRSEREAAARATEETPAAPYPPPVAEHPGGPCPSCGQDTVPGAKFCGECGTRLVS